MPGFGALGAEALHALLSKLKHTSRYLRSSVSALRSCAAPLWSSVVALRTLCLYARVLFDHLRGLLRSSVSALRPSVVLCGPLWSLCVVLFGTPCPLCSPLRPHYGPTVTLCGPLCPHCGFAGVALPVVFFAVLCVALLLCAGWLW